MICSICSTTKTKIHFQCVLGECLIVLTNDDNNNQGKNAQRFSNGTGGRCKACWLKLCIEKFKIDCDTRRTLLEKYCQKSEIIIAVDNNKSKTPVTNKKHKIVLHPTKRQKEMFNKKSKKTKIIKNNVVDSSTKKTSTIENDSKTTKQEMFIKRKKHIHQESNENNKQINLLKLQFSTANEISSNNHMTMPLNVVVQCSEEEISSNHFPYSSTNFIDCDSNYKIEQNTAIKTPTNLTEPMKTVQFGSDNSMMISTAEMFSRNNDYQMVKRTENKQTKINPLLNMKNLAEEITNNELNVEKSRWLIDDKKKIKTLNNQNSSEAFIIANGCYFPNQINHHHESMND